MGLDDEFEDAIEGSLSDQFEECEEGEVDQSPRRDNETFPTF